MTLDMTIVCRIRIEHQKRTQRKGCELRLWQKFLNNIGGHRNTAAFLIWNSGVFCSKISSDRPIGGDTLDKVCKICLLSTLVTVVSVILITI